MHTRHAYAFYMLFSLYKQVKIDNFFKINQKFSCSSRTLVRNTYTTTYFFE